MKIIGADERLAEKRGAKILIVGPAGVGKTSSAAHAQGFDHAIRRHRGRRPRRTGPPGRHHSRRRLVDRARPRVSHRRSEPVVPSDRLLLTGAF